MGSNKCGDCIYCLQLYIKLGSDYSAISEWRCFKGIKRPIDLQTDACENGFKCKLLSLSADELNKEVLP